MIPSVLFAFAIVVSSSLETLFSMLPCLLSHALQDGFTRMFTWKRCLLFSSVCSTYPRVDVLL